MPTKEPLRRPGGKRSAHFRRPAFSSTLNLLFPPAEQAVLGFLLTCGTLPDGCKPFGLGFAAASGGGWQGGAALFGILLETALLEQGGPALRYAAAAILLYGVSFACCELPFFHTRFFLPLCCAGASALTGFLYLSGVGWSRALLLRYGWEVLLSGISCLIFQAGKKQRPLKTLWLGAGLTAAAGGVHPILGTACAAFGTLAAARRGAGTGAAAGGVLGLSAGLVPGGSPALAAVLCCSGASAGAVSPQSRLAFSALFPLCAGVLSLWCGVTFVFSAAFAAALLYSFLPEAFWTFFEKKTGLGTSPQTLLSPTSVEIVRYRLEEQSTAFRTLYQRIHDSVAQEEPAESSGVILQQVKERLCAGCPRHGFCWQQNHLFTSQAMTRALCAAQDRGTACAEDFALLQRQCLHRQELVRLFNEELYRFWNRRQYRARMKNNRLAVCRQYEQLSGLLRSAAAALEEAVTLDEEGAKRAQQTAAALGCSCRCTLYRDGRGRHTLELLGTSLEEMNSPQGAAALSQALEAEMEPWDVFSTPQGQKLVFRQKPPLTAKVAATSRQKDPAQLNGDNGIWFRDSTGILWVILCDGMGSGAAAAGESRLLMTLLKDFLHAGIHPEAALSTLTGAMSLRGEASGGFTTVDLLKIDLFNGSAALYKLGSAPSYLRKNGAVSRITGGSLPAGLETDRESRPDCTQLSLAAGDLLLMITDGITDGEGDTWLRKTLNGYEGDSPRELAQRILASPAAGREDDRTVVAVRIGKRV